MISFNELDELLYTLLFELFDESLFDSIDEILDLLDMIILLT